MPPGAGIGRQASGKQISAQYRYLSHTGTVETSSLIPSLWFAADKVVEEKIQKMRGVRPARCNLKGGEVQLGLTIMEERHHQAGMAQLSR
jgi:hypothetical protein